MWGFSLLQASAQLFYNAYFPVFEACSPFGAKYRENGMVEECGAYNNLYSEPLSHDECQSVEIVVHSHSHPYALP